MLVEPLDPIESDLHSNMMAMAMSIMSTWW